MGLLNIIKNQLIEVIEWTDDSRDTLSYRWPDEDKEIKNGAQLIVRESQLVQFVAAGQYADIFKPGKHTLTTENVPVLSTILGWKYGFQSPFKCDVYYLNTRLFTGNKWGTANPVMMRDRDFGVVRLRAFGTYDLCRMKGRLMPTGCEWPCGQVTGQAPKHAPGLGLRGALKKQAKRHPHFSAHSRPAISSHAMNSPRPSRLILFNKPYGVLSQFTPEGRWRGLKDFIAIAGVYVAGRLDADSEGLLLMTNDGQLQARIADPRFKLEKTYWVQVEGRPDEAALEALRLGVQLNDGPTRPAQARLMTPPTALWEREPPIRVRASIPAFWIELTIKEGRNRQVRRMTAAVGFPTLRLIRAAIGPYTLDGLAPGNWREGDADLVALDINTRQSRRTSP